MFRKLTLADIFKQDIAAAEVLAHDHEKAAEHHDALATMYRGRVERLKADMDNWASKPVPPKAQQDWGMKLKSASHTTEQAQP